ncbi:MAG: replication-relaxation family protein [Chloroflexota bacterium]|nr:replication-relaxation family protein [Chloroflexota bacterium]
MTTLLSKRETDALLLLGCYRYLGRRQLQEFLLSGSETTPLSREVIGKRVLASLRSKRLVATTKRLVGGPGGGSTRLGYYLTTSGIRLARSLNPDLPARRPASGGTFLMQHALMTADVALGFGRAALSHPGHELLDWECDWQAAAQLGSSPVVPDARLIYATADHEVDALVEIDLGTEGTRFFARKILSYLNIFRSRDWQKRLPQWPVVLTVTRDDARAMALQRCTESVLQSQIDRERLLIQTEFAFAGLPDVVDDPLAIVWRIAGRNGRHALLDGRHL